MKQALLITLLAFTACKDPNVNYVTAVPADKIAVAPHGQSVEE